jgi:hypothetical protein
MNVPLYHVDTMERARRPPPQEIIPVHAKTTGQDTTAISMWTIAISPHVKGVSATTYKRTITASKTVTSCWFCY